MLKISQRHWFLEEVEGEENGEKCVASNGDRALRDTTEVDPDSHTARPKLGATGSLSLNPVIEETCGWRG